ncbi:DNA-directed RNA polymerase [Mycoemilia scoparia]|uniref:DNA-directed RNA polymerase n=1 Tax=Mycoemilia scoparia TaxID=417184 RepID=A0A9W8A7Y8_9FUNG|nr:DNA-directed RNA polymerase [Mycoemilia scoparia]
MKEIMDIETHNSILDGLLNMKPRPLTNEALEWYEKLETDYKIKPDANTFAIIINGFIKAGSPNVARVLISEMKRKNIEFGMVLLSCHLSDTDIDQIKNIAKDILGSSGVTMSSSFSKKYLGQETQEKSDTKISPSGKVLPEVRSTNVLGIKLLKQMLNPLQEDELDAYEKQIRLEEEAYDAALERLKSVNEARQDPLLSSDTGAIRSYMSEWLPKLTALIEEEVNLCKTSPGTDRERHYYGPFLKLVSPEKLAIIVLSDTFRLHSQSFKEFLVSSNGEIKGLKTPKLAGYIGRQVELEYHHTELKKKKNSNLIARNINLQRLAANGRLFNMTVRKAQAKVEREIVNTDWIKSWPPIVRMKIGSMLLSMMIQCAKIKERKKDPETGKETVVEVPAFSHSYLTQRGKIYGIISINDSLTKLFGTQRVNDTLNARWLPMLVPPKPWLSYNSGGYLTYKSLCMRTKDAAEQRNYLQRASDEDRLNTILTGLDVLGQTKWAINNRVFDIVLNIWNSGIELADIPPAYKEEIILPKADDFDTNKEARMRWYMETKAARHEVANNHSLRCDVNYKIEIARAFLDKPMYFPHNLDFRGRTYPIPPHFNHLGNDLCRGLLLFYEARPLGERGLHWLKIHMANMFGYDKYSHDERIKFTQENLENIFDSADKPLDGKRWWLSAENPWQALATCMELTDALRSPDPLKFMSRLHVHQDGTCNGLQHYAALGCDRSGAKHVNLLPSERPQDVYAAILHFVIKGIEKDVADDIREAKVLRGWVTRKVIKQTVMTNVYGVTLIGAKEQIMNRLREIEKDGKPVFDIMDLQPLSIYLAHKVFDSLGEVFTCARMIQDWLNESASRISKSMPESILMDCLNSKSKKKVGSRKKRAATKVVTDPSVDPVNVPIVSEKALKRKKLEFIEKLRQKPMSSVVWTTPLGLTVVQPYRKQFKKQVPTHLQSLSLKDSSVPSPVNTQKQKTAFPPNFIHSLDAAHMTLSAIECNRKGLVFASVHDSYWTHAGDVDVMNEVLRDQFVALHRYPIMENLKEEFEERYKNYMMPVAVDKQQIMNDKARSKTATEKQQDAKTDEKSANGIAKKQKKSLPEHLNAIFDDAEAEEDSGDVDELALSGNTKDNRSNGHVEMINGKRIRWVPLEFPPLPERGDFDINEVLQSPYFFS